MLGQLLKKITGAERRFASPPAAAKLHVGSRISSCPPDRLTCTDKHWSEMSTWEKVQAGPFLCIVNPDEYDKRWGKYFEYFILFKSQEEYDWQKKYVIATGRWEEFVHQNEHHKNQ